MMNPLEMLRELYGKAVDDFKELLMHIFNYNTVEMEHKVFKYNQAVLSGKRGKYELPDGEKVLRGYTMTKQFKKNVQSLNDTLRERVQRALKNAVADYRGTKTNKGKIAPELIAKMKRNLQATMSGYRYPDARTGNPPNVDIIAVTEGRSAINGFKDRYAVEFLRLNPGKKIIKRWIHNRHLSITPRKNHAEQNGHEKPFNQPFRIRRPVGGGYDSLMHPHDRTAPANQVINCNCDVQYIVK